MKVNSTKPVQSLDDEFDLFDDSEWNFMDVVAETGKNFEYFDDVEDTEFKRSKLGFLRSDFFSVATFALVLLIGIAIAIFYTGVFNDDEYKELLSMQSVNMANNVTYVDGTEASSDDIIAVSAVINQYFDNVTAAKDYAPLYGYVVTTSNFSDTYYTMTDKIKVMYDANDCYARLLRKFASLCVPGKINKLLIKDGIYYCYLDFTFPNKTDITDYMGMYSYNLSKYFSGRPITEENIAKYLIEQLDQSKMSCHTEEYCIKLVKSDTGFKLSSDNFMTSICTDAYTDILAQVMNQLGGSMPAQM